MSAPLRVGIVGCGNVALNFHVPAYQALPDRYEIVGLRDLDVPADSFARRRALFGLTPAGA